MNNKRVLTTIREMAHNKEIHVIYDKIPGTSKGVYLKSKYDAKLSFVLIDESIKDTMGEIEQLAYFIGIIVANEDLELDAVNNYKEDELSVRMVNKLALIHQEELLESLL